MSVSVTLCVFSGRPNPVWELTEDQISELQSRLASLRSLTLLKPPGFLGKPGYSGFLIRSSQESGLPDSIYIHAGVVDFSRGIANKLEDAPELESWLLTTGGARLPKPAKAWAEEGINRDFRSRNVFLNRPITPLLVPSFNPHKWNDDSNVQTQNNCYNYACDIITNSFAQPGRGSGAVFTTFACGNVGTGATNDGLAASGKPNATPAQGQYVALVMADGIDFHWLRQDVDATWSQKHGTGPAINVDDAGNAITDPETCNRSIYTDFCGYFLCIPSSCMIV